ncbi:uncharacterized protein lcorl isoform X2 [Hoplias malabaricus]|uniref:uncharacterized protein lcorl isoform X2 n=1 Tax=Hoplias malabaricus TaxID=27720 RepID=UPI003462B148
MIATFMLTFTPANRFESILEGIYGPRLLQDLSIFDDCEPEVVSDWSTEACCPFCNLQLEKLIEHSPVSPPPTETPPPQGLSSSEKLQCQASQFLHAVFHKKEFPESGDPSIPLAAQELMRKMIRQFAIEYVYKSQPEAPEGQTPTSQDLHKNGENDGPLDLTVSRETHESPLNERAAGHKTQCPQQEGVLDLSKKNSSVNGLSPQSVTGSLVAVDGDQSRKEEEKRETEEWKDTVLEKVLSSLCSYHRSLLYSILQEMHVHYKVALALRDSRRRLAKTEPHCCPSEPSSPRDLLTCSLTACGIQPCAVTSVCFCVKTLSGLSCPNIALGCVGNVVCYGHHRMITCQHQRNTENLCISHHHPPSILSNSHNACRTCRSPSPPPLSPKPLDMECKTTEQTSSCKGQELMELSRPPPLLPHRTEAEEENKGPTTLVKAPDTEEENKHHCGSLLGDLMDTFDEKLKNIQPPQKEQNTHSCPKSKPCDDTHLTEIITTVLRSSSDKEYDLKQLFEQQMSTEQRSPQTRSRRRQEILAAMNKSLNIPASRRQSLQIKRDIARFDLSACRRKLPLDRGRCPKNIQELPMSIQEQPGSSKVLLETKPTEEVSETPCGGPSPLTSEVQSNREEQEMQSPELSDIPLSNEADTHQKGVSQINPITKFDQDKSQIFQPNGRVERSRRNIVPPQRFSSYVTEPRKMYYAACFSESVFNKQSLNNNATCKPDSSETDDHTPTKTDTDHSIKREAPDHTVPTASDESDKLPVSPKIIKACEDESGEYSQAIQNPRTDWYEHNATPTKTSQPCSGERLTESQIPMLTQGQSTDTDILEDTKEFALTYVSPIKLMLVSPVKGENGVKYTLKAADTGSKHSKMFDPCIEASWAGSSINEEIMDKDLQGVSLLNSEAGSTDNNLSEVSTDEVGLINHTSVGEALRTVNEMTPVKRRPGRPKKLGPHIEKVVKRPIGRPPKAKAGDPNSVITKNVVSQIASENEEEGNKNLKITITCGRSRKTRRVVSEDMGQFSRNQGVHEVHNCGSSDETGGTNDSVGSVNNMAKNPFVDLKFVMPVEDRKAFIHSSSNIKCQKQSDLAMTRKPGRPPKVKISGISVTVTTVSPRQRRIHIKRDLKDLPPKPRALIMESEPSTEELPINECTVGVGKDVEVTMKEHSKSPRTSFFPIRHSVRERKPSIHLLHSVATARSLSRSNALLCRSRKLLMSKASQQTRQGGPQLAANKALLKKTSKVSNLKNVGRFSGVSVDSIFASDESLKWWLINTSPETINEKMAKRIKLMSDTWVSEVLEAKKSEEIKTKPNSTPCEKVTGFSAVKMLFERDYSMENLCSWFMQTTETQSLAIVKKTSAKNPYEIFHYDPIGSPCRDDVCPSPQAERLRKHVKKFAKIVPKSPEMHRKAQARLQKIRKSFCRCSQYNPFTLLQKMNGQRTFRSFGTWRIYRMALLRAKARFRIRTKKTLSEAEHRNLCDPLTLMLLETKQLETPVNEVHDASHIPDNKRDESSEKRLVVADTSKEEQISSKSWSPERLKECRVFLKKINSTDTASVSEGYNICTVKLNISPAECDVSVEQKEQKCSVTTKLKTLNSLRKRSSTSVNQNKFRKKRKSPCTSEAPPVKMMRQSRCNRGVLGPKWCDFILGPSK